MFSSTGEDPLPQTPGTAPRGDGARASSSLTGEIPFPRTPFFNPGDFQSPGTPGPVSLSRQRNQGKRAAAAACVRRPRWVAPHPDARTVRFRAPLASRSARRSGGTPRPASTVGGSAALGLRTSPRRSRRLGLKQFRPLLRLDLGKWRGSDRGSRISLAALAIPG